MVSEAEHDRTVREALRLSTELMTAQTLDDEEAQRSCMQNIVDFVFGEPEQIEDRFNAYMQANAHISSFLVDFAATATYSSVEWMISSVATTIITRTDEDESDPPER